MRSGADLSDCELLHSAQAGVPARASEIFDWLRGLPGVHPLSALCDVYTYTTIIAQVSLGFRADTSSLQQVRQGMPVPALALSYRPAMLFNVVISVI
jgi:hypothetical protein